jgi:hypothetical protein
MWHFRASADDDHTLSASWGKAKLERERRQKKREKAKEAGIKICTRCLKFMDPLVEGPVLTLIKGDYPRLFGQPNHNHG